MFARSSPFRCNPRQFLAQVLGSRQPGHHGSDCGEWRRLVVSRRSRWGNRIAAGSGIEDAVNNAITRAGKTIRNMKWFEVAEVPGHLENNKVADWQVTVKVGFTLDT
jgi:flavin-binding protein dodecin